MKTPDDIPVLVPDSDAGTWGDLRPHEIGYLKTGRWHEEIDDCRKFGCCIHNPTDHHMRGFALNWRSDRQLMERICPHGVGHPDPDHLAWVRRTKGKNSDIMDRVHGCDGCCHE